tara:strand:+ start:1016 stop:1987 length:972 start_codon:yes stop_codon:yes gene_type:complete
MVSASPSPAHLPKVVLTKTVVENERSIIVSQNKYNSTPVIEGALINYNAPEAFILYSGTSHELIDSHVVSSVKPAVIITIVIDGKLTFGYDDVEFTLDGSKRIEVVMINLTQPVRFYRSIEKDNRLTKVNIVVSPSWLNSRLSKNDRRHHFTLSHLNNIKVPITDEIHTVVREILSSVQPADFLQKLRLESLALSVIQQMFTLVYNAPRIQSAPQEPNQSTRIKSILYFIETHLDAPLDLESLATKLSMSSSNLQRIFKEELGITVKKYIRQRRLYLAKANLERGIVTITEAAYEAGYTHPANFTIAFKKEFGIPPAKVVQQS